MSYVGSLGVQVHIRDEGSYQRVCTYHLFLRVRETTAPPPEMPPKPVSAVPAAPLSIPADSLWTWPRRTRRWAGNTAQTRRRPSSPLSRKYCSYLRLNKLVIDSLLLTCTWMCTCNSKKELGELATMIDTIVKQQRLPTHSEMDAIMVRACRCIVR